MRFPAVTLADWRAQVDKELGGKPFEKVLVQEAIEGLRLDPLYTEAPPTDVSWRAHHARPFRICIREAEDATPERSAADLAAGADALWLSLDQALRLPALGEGKRPFFLIDAGASSPQATASRALADLSGARDGHFALGFDPVALRVDGTAPFASLADDLGALGRAALLLEAQAPTAIACTVSTLAYHDAGADPVQELAIALSTGVAHLEALLGAGLSPDRAAPKIALQLAVGSDTFLELCKLRALRTCWQKILTAAGVAGAPHALVHAVASSRTMTVRDPWVNMLRATTQVFAAVLGGADLVTPRAFDELLGASDLGRRVAQNTGLVLREESYLGQVHDPAGGSYYFETVTLAIAREAWKRFRDIEREGGIAKALENGRIGKEIETSWRARRGAIAKRKVPILGVSEFAHLGEVLPGPLPRESSPKIAPSGLVAQRDAAAFERLRALAETKKTPPQALLITLGEFAESRGRVGFASGFFAAGGIRTRESVTDEKAPIACICGTDERYAALAAARVRALKAAGCHRVLLAGRPGALEPSLREAGIDGFIFVGCDAVTTLSDLLDTPS